MSSRDGIVNLYGGTQNRFREQERKKRKIDGAAADNGRRAENSATRTADSGSTAPQRVLPTGRG
jgi:hypothetical protein